jgi:hypothetical protein
MEEDQDLATIRGDELRSAVRLIEMCRDVAELYEGIDLKKLWKEHG